MNRLPSRFRPPIMTKVRNPILTERLRRTVQAYGYIEHDYIFGRANDSPELLHSIYAEFPVQVKKKLLTLIRVMLPGPGHFEFDKEGKEIDNEFKVKEALVYSVTETVMDPKNEDTNVFSQYTTRVGVYRRPFAIFEYEYLGNRIGSTINQYRNMFYTEFNEKNVKKVLDEFGGKCRGLALAIAVEGAENWYGGKKYAVPNFQEFLTEDFDNVLAACLGEFLREEPFGVQLYLMNKEQKRKRLEEEVEAFTKQPQKK